METLKLLKQRSLWGGVGGIEEMHNRVAKVIERLKEVCVWYCVHPRRSIDAYAIIYIFWGCILFGILAARHNLNVDHTWPVHKPAFSTLPSHKFDLCTHTCRFGRAGSLHPPWRSQSRRRTIQSPSRFRQTWMGMFDFCLYRLRAEGLR
jgi:hypothetical protein